MKPKNTFIILVGILVLGVLGFFAFNQYIYHQKQASETILPPFDGEITGEYVCLPHKDTRGPQTMECAYGIRLEDGTHLALDFGQNQQDLSQFQVGQTARLNGHLIPIEAVSSSHWFKYDTRGIFYVSPEKSSNP